MSGPMGVPLWNGGCASLGAIADRPFSELRCELLRSLGDDERVAAFFAVPEASDEGDATARLFAILVGRPEGRLRVLSARATGAFDSLAPERPELQLFEREIHEQCGLQPLGHPSLAPVRRPLAYAESGGPTCFRVEGEEVHEVAVGPVHAGVIEPGHFRFQCHGERVFYLESVLGYQHRGIERALVGGPDVRSIHLAEQVAGDSSVAHATAYAQVVEGLCGSAVPPRAQALRAVALELERIANHTGDLGALAGDAGYLPVASFCGRLRGDFLQLTAELCGSRFGRGLVRPGGVVFDAEESDVERILAGLERAMSDLTRATELLWSTPSVSARFDGVGVLCAERAREIGLVGVAARASGLERDVRRDLPLGYYRFHQIHPVTWSSGDVLARALVRRVEIERSAAFVKEVLARLPAGETRVSLAPLRPGTMGVAVVEGWRGELVHVALTDDRGRFAHYKIVDPSFHNWLGLCLAVRGESISDFPLCNKSFNLSYCGHDL